MGLKAEKQNKSQNQRIKTESEHARVWGNSNVPKAVLFPPENANACSGSFLCAVPSVQMKGLVAMTAIPSPRINGHSGRFTSPALVETPVEKPPVSEPKTSEWFIYLVDVPRDWEFPRHHTTSPKAGPKISYQAAAEAVAAMNRHYLQRYEGKQTKHLWAVCVRRGDGFAVLKLNINRRYRPQNEFVMPNTDFVEVCTDSEIREKLTTINKVVSTFNPKSISMKWAVAAKSIQLEDLPVLVNEPVELLYDVVTSAGQILQTGLTQAQADEYADLHNSLNQNSDTVARIELSVM